jgi:ketosteroid isomerase-like protein
MASKVASNAEIVGSYLEAVLRKDHSAVERFFDPEIEYFVNGTSQRDAELRLPPISAELESALPWLGHHKGHAGVRAFLDTMHSNLDVTAYGPREVISEGNKAAAFGWFRLHALTTNRTIDIAYAILFELRDGKIIRYQFLENTFDVAAAFRAGGSWPVKRNDGVHNVAELS